MLTRIGTHHFAFLRGYLEGLDLALLAKRYLETADDTDAEQKAAKAALKWIRQQLMVAARRRGHFPEARLILIDPGKLDSPQHAAIPTLAEFREERDPHEMYSEAELLALFHEEFGELKSADRRALRNERLRRRQLAALAELEGLLDTTPQDTDEVGGWLDTPVAGRLQAAGIRTLADLVGTINARGYRWWTQVPRLGEKTAAQIVAWLRTEPVAQALGMPLRIQAGVKERQIPPPLLLASRPKEFGIVPLEYLLLPPELDGRNGTNRGSTCLITASSDPEAIAAWLATKKENPSTWRSYRKEAERFLLWAVMERRRALSSLTQEDVIAYREFLARLDESASSAWPFSLPRSAWIGVRGTDRWSALWRPFDGPLSPGSQALAITIVAGMFRWLTTQGYLAFNPWKGLTGKSLKRSGTTVS
ncbi:phage integrase family protein [Noviherbaspirillum massiliense]|uniref:phage integrase family protein n=1 Tax=Noviherbaspirillum massiliense TaxID=1465823 RepID=UPI00030B70F8|nr:phage integrase family protein [Noviherbaspirillum massiliense]